MKDVAQSMTPDEAAQAFFGQDDAAFHEMIKRLTKNDPRLAGAFSATRARYLNSKEP